MELGPPGSQAATWARPSCSRASRVGLQNPPAHHHDDQEEQKQKQWNKLEVSFRMTMMAITVNLASARRIQCGWLFIYNCCRGKMIICNDIVIPLKRSSVALRPT